MGLYTNNVGTNPVVFTAPATVNITKGKVSGQDVTGVASAVSANLLY